MGAFSGGKKLEQALADIAKSMDGGSVQVGFMAGANYPDGTPVAAVAFWNEYGHGGPFPAPPRPFFRKMIAAESPGWSMKVAKLAKATKYDGERVLAMMGEDIGGGLAQSIIQTTEPALSPTTLMLRSMFGNKPENIRARDVLEAQRKVAKGETGATGTQANPLVWTGHMLHSIAYKVNDGTEVPVKVD